MVNSAEVCADSGGVTEKWGGGLLIFFFFWSLVCAFAAFDSSRVSWR